MSPSPAKVTAQRRRRRPWYEDADSRDRRAGILRRDRDRCRRCGSQGEPEVDHIVPIADGGDPWDPENLQALCRRCHRAKTSAEASGRAARRRAANAYRAAAVILVMPTLAGNSTPFVWTRHDHSIPVDERPAVEPAVHVPERRLPVGRSVLEEDAIDLFIGWVVLKVHVPLIELPHRR